MKIFKCTICGGEQSIPDGVIELECEYCGNRQIVDKDRTEAVREKKKTNEKLQCTLLAMLQERILRNRIFMCTEIVLLLAVIIIAILTQYTPYGVLCAIAFCPVAFSVFKLIRMIKVDLAIFEKYKDPFQNVYKADMQLKEKYRKLKAHQIEQLLEKLSSEQ